MQDKLVALTVATLVAVGMGCGPKEDATMEGSPDAATPSEQLETEQGEVGESPPDASTVDLGAEEYPLAPSGNNPADE